MSELTLPTLQGGRSNRRAEKAAAEVPANEAFNLDSGTWASEPAMTQQRTALAAAALGGSLYALGGQAGAETCSSVEAYDALQVRFLRRYRYKCSGIYVQLLMGLSEREHACLYGGLVCSGLCLTQQPGRLRKSRNSSFQLARAAGGLAAAGACADGSNADLDQTWPEAKIKPHLSTSHKHEPHCNWLTHDWTMQGVWRVCQGSLRVGRKYCCAAPLNGALESGARPASDRLVP